MKARVARKIYKRQILMTQARLPWKKKTFDAAMEWWYQQFCPYKVSSVAWAAPERLFKAFNSKPNGA